MAKYFCVASDVFSELPKLHYHHSMLLIYQSHFEMEKYRFSDTVLLTKEEVGKSKQITNVTFPTKDLT